MSDLDVYTPSKLVSTHSNSFTCSGRAGDSARHRNLRSGSSSKRLLAVVQQPVPFVETPASTSMMSTFCSPKCPRRRFWNLGSIQAGGWRLACSTETARAVLGAGSAQRCAAATAILAAVSGSRAGICHQCPATAGLANHAGSGGGGCVEGSKHCCVRADGKAQGVFGILVAFSSQGLEKPLA